jgi:hypothetical protein
MVAAKLENGLKDGPIDPDRTAGERHAMRIRAVKSLAHRLNVQLQERGEGVLEQLHLSLAEHADEVGRPQLTRACKLVDELPRAGLRDRRKRRPDGVSLENRIQASPPPAHNPRARIGLHATICFLRCC